MHDIKCKSGFAKISAANLTNLCGILSKPPELLGFMAPRSFITSFDVAKDGEAIVA